MVPRNLNLYASSYAKGMYVEKEYVTNKFILQRLKRQELIILNPAGKFMCQITHWNHSANIFSYHCFKIL